MSGATGRIGAAVKRVHLVCDSTADLGLAYYPAHDVEVVPLSIIFGEEQFLDQLEMSTREFYRRMRAGGPPPQTPPPTPGGVAGGVARARPTHRPPSHRRGCSRRSSSGWGVTAAPWSAPPSPPI